MNNIHICTKDNPWNPDLSTCLNSIQHPDAETIREDYDWYDGDGEETKKCLWCYTEFKVYLGR